MAVLLCGFSMCVTSCKDDDDDNKSEEQQQEEQEAQTSKFWSVVGQLVSSDDYADDYQDKTFEPAIGYAESEGSLTRIVETNDMQTAASRFADLVGATDIDENTESYTYSDPEVGTLTYTRGGSPNEWATVDVSIKQVPRLRSIIYRQGDGTNAANPKKAWYRFGDVVSRKNKDDQTEYWICIRPAFVHESKSESHWVCLNTLPTKNLEHVSGSNGTEYYVPKGVKTDTENMQNLAEMLYAIFNPDEWYENANNYHTDGKLWGFSGLPIFTDFKKANLQYHNQHFWQKVAYAWEDLRITELAMNTGYGILMDRINHEGINLLYNGYSWWSTTSWNCTLYQASYTNGTSNDKKNLHQETLTDIKKNVKPFKLDCRVMGENMSNYQDFFGDNKLRWVVRHAKGTELNGGTRPAPTAQLQGGCTDVYRYYWQYPSESIEASPDGGDGPEVTSESGSINNAPNNSNGIFQMGDVLKCIDDGTVWFCMLGKPNTTTLPIDDDEATFVSLDIPQYNGVKAQGLPTEAELPEIAYSFLRFIHSLTNSQMDRANKGKLGTVGNHIRRYANIDLHDLYLCLDSVWTFRDNSNKLASSPSGSTVTNLAYDDGSPDHQAVARIIEDMTQAGNERTKCFGTTADGKTYKFQDWHFHVFKHYEYYDASLQTPFPTGWNEVGGTAWQWLWPVSNTRITLQDLTSQELVNRYASIDKWVRLPIKLTDETKTERRSPRTQAETSVRPADFFYRNGMFTTAKRSMWNEPVLFIRVAKIKDPGYRRLNLTSTDGREFEVIHMQYDKNMYSSNFASQWVFPSILDRNSAFYLDNVLTPLPEFKMKQ